MTKSISNIGIALFLSVAAVAQGQQKLDGTYLQMVYALGNLETVHMFFLPDGHFMEGVPVGGLTLADYNNTCKTGKVFCGTYQIAGGRIKIFDAQGKVTRDEAFKQNAQGNIEIGNDATKLQPFPAGQRLDGNYVWNGSSSDRTVMASREYQFRPDGTVKTSSSKTGTYRITGNIIEITLDGTTQRLVAFPFAMEDKEPPMRPGRISINGALYKP